MKRSQIIALLDLVLREDRKAQVLHQSMIAMATVGSSDARTLIAATAAMQESEAARDQARRQLISGGREG